MTDNQHFLFVLARPSKAISVPSSEFESIARRMVEEKWASLNGIDVERIREAATGTDTTPAAFSTASSTLSDTVAQTENGLYISLDSSTDSTNDALPDIHNDDPHNPLEISF